GLAKRLESAFRQHGFQFRVYQFLLKSTHEQIPHGSYDNPVVKQAIDDRAAYFDKKSAELYSLRICYVILCEGFRYQAKLGSTLQKLVSEPKQAVEELKGYLGSRKQTVLISDAIEKQHRVLLHQIRSF